MNLARKSFLLLSGLNLSTLVLPCGVMAVESSEALRRAARIEKGRRQEREL